MILVGKKHGNRCESEMTYVPGMSNVALITKSALCDRVFNLTLAQALSTFNMEKASADRVEQSLWEFHGGTFV